MASRPARSIYSPLLPLLALGGIAALGLPSSATAQQTWYEGDTLVIGGAAPKGSVTVDMSVLEGLGQGGAYAAPKALARPGQRIVLNPPQKAKPAPRRQAPTTIAKPASTSVPTKSAKPVQTQSETPPVAAKPADPTPAAKVSVPAAAAPEPLAPSSIAHTTAPSTTATTARTETPAPADRAAASVPAPASTASTPAPEPVAKRSIATESRAPDPVAAGLASAPETAPEPEPATAAKPHTVAAVTPATPPLPAAAPRATPPVSQASSPAAAAPTPTRTAAVMPAPQPRTAPSANDGMLRIAFSGEAATLTDPSRDNLKKVAAALSKDSSLRVQVRAYASGTPETASKARRVSLSRALAVRSYLIEQGVGSTRIDVRALGNNVESGPGDRVDLVLVSR